MCVFLGLAFSFTPPHCPHPHPILPLKTFFLPFCTCCPLPPPHPHRPMPRMVWFFPQPPVGCPSHLLPFLCLPLFVGGVFVCWCFGGGQTGTLPPLSLLPPQYSLGLLETGDRHFPATHGGGEAGRGGSHSLPPCLAAAACLLPPPPFHHACMRREETLWKKEGELPFYTHLLCHPFLFSHWLCLHTFPPPCPSLPKRKREEGQHGSKARPGSLFS